MFPAPSAKFVHLTSHTEVDQSPPVTINPLEPVQFTLSDTQLQVAYVADVKPLPNRPESRLLSVYNAVSNSGQEIRIMSESGATISLLHQDTTHELGDITYNGQTKIKGVGNNPLERTSQIMKFNLNTSFKDKWEDKEINAAVLDEITQIQHEDLTAPIS